MAIPRAAVSILSASFPSLHTRRTPVADMLANSPHLPLIIDHFEDDVITRDDEEGIILGLLHHDRVCRIRLRSSISNLQQFIFALNGEFPILEYLLIYHSSTDTHDTSLNLPETFRAPHLLHLFLMDFALPIESPSLTTMANLVNLDLDSIPPSAYFHPNVLLQRISLMPRLELLGISFGFQLLSGDIERQLLHASIMTHVTLPNLRGLLFQGASAYFEALLPWVTIPLLETLAFCFCDDQQTHSIPHLQEFMSSGWNFHPTATALHFYEDYLLMKAYPRKGATVYSLFIGFRGESP